MSNLTTNGIASIIKTSKAHTLITKFLGVLIFPSSYIKKIKSVGEEDKECWKSLGTMD
jgi:hypothetical protein